MEVAILSELKKKVDTSIFQVSTELVYSSREINLLLALESAIPSVTIEQAIGDAEARKRALPSHLVVCLLIAMSLWSSDSIRTVLKNLVDGLSEVWVKVGQYWRVVTSTVELGRTRNQMAAKD